MAAFKPTLDAVYPWATQVVQYPEVGAAGITYYPGPIKGVGIVDCLLYRNRYGRVIGILNHYPFDHALEKKGNVNIWVRPDCQRQGIGSALWIEAELRWPVTLKGQRFTRAGAALANHLKRLS